MLLSPDGVAVLGQSPLQVFRFADINQLVLLIVDEVDTGGARKGLHELRAKFPIEV